MDYFEAKPSPAVAGSIKQFWSLRRERLDVVLAPEPIFPDGCIEVVFDFSDRFVRHFECGKVETQPRTIVAGQITAPIFIAPSGDTDLFGVRFHPAGARDFLNIPLSEITDVVVDATEILGKLECNFFERMLVAKTFHERSKTFEELFTQVVGTKKRAANELNIAIALMHQNEGCSRISRIAEHLAWSERRLERHFQDIVGISPKLYARITRFQTIIRHFKDNNGFDMADYAYSSGYTDQSHMIREFKNFTGTTPGKYLGEKYLLSDYFVRAH